MTRSLPRAGTYLFACALALLIAADLLADWMAAGLGVAAALLSAGVFGTAPVIISLIVFGLPFFLVCGEVSGASPTLLFVATGLIAGVLLLTRRDWHTGVAHGSRRTAALALIWFACVSV